MAYKPIIGFDGATPVLNYAGTAPVVMEPESVNPHWSFTSINAYRCSVSTSAPNVTATFTSGAENYFSTQFDLFVVAPVSTTMTFTITGSSVNWHRCIASRMVNGSAITGSLDLRSYDSVFSGTLAVPYYRFRLRLALYGGNNYPDDVTTPLAAGAYSRVAIVFS